MEASVTLNLLHVLIGFGMLVLTIIGMLTANRRHMEKSFGEKADVVYVDSKCIDLKAEIDKKVNKDVIELMLKAQEDQGKQIQDIHAYLLSKK